MRTSVRIVTTALAAAALFGLAPAAIAEPAGEGPTVGASAVTVISNHYRVTNLSTLDLKLVSIIGQRSDDELMPIGTVLHPGQSHPFGVTFHLFETDPYRVATFEAFDPATGQRKGTLTVSAKYGVDDGRPRTAVNVRGSTPLAATADDHGYYITDPTPTTIEVSAGQGQLQADVLRSICADGSAATCTFTPTGYRRGALSDARDVLMYANHGQNPAPMEHTTGLTLSESNSINLGFAASTKLTVLAQEIEVQFSAEYGHAWQREETDLSTVGQSVPSGLVGLITEQHPVDRVTGDYTVKLGTTTWRLRGIAFDSPLPVTAGSTVFAYHEWPIGSPRPTAAELSAAPSVAPRVAPSVVSAAR